ncbi:MAG: hybrid sensor histidine kinase/response regulator [Betaproteobacteria bacterium]
MENEKELRLVLEAMPAAAVRCDRHGRYLWVNPLYARWLGSRPEALVGKSIAEVLGPKGARELEPYLERVRKGEELHYERLADYPGIGPRWVSATLKPTLNAGGQPDGWVAIVLDIHDRKQAEEALRQGEARKDEFLAALAHELRNPLAPIRNAVAILGRKGPLDPEVAWSQGVIERQIDQLSRLIDDLLDIERISRGRLQLRRELVPLEAVVDMALELSRPQVNATGRHLSVLMPSERVTLDADAARLAQVFAALIKHAAREGDSREPIGFSVVAGGREAIVSVEGCRGGLEGLGIGLTLVRGIVGLHGGTLEARGDEFVVRLPVAAGAMPARERAAAYLEPQAQPLRVLVADDTRDAADSMQRILALFGHEVQVAYDGPTAMRLGEQFRPRVALLDIGMPGTNGYDVARALRRSQGERVTLVAVTGWGQEADRRRSSEAGFDHHLTKPVDPGTLNHLLAQVAAK